jgi:hypothetical protein
MRNIRLFHMVKIPAFAGGIKTRIYPDRLNIRSFGRKRRR